MPRVIDYRNLLIICSLFDVILVANYNEKIPNELDKAVDKLHDDFTNKKKNKTINAFSY